MKLQRRGWGRLRGSALAASLVLALFLAFASTAAAQTTPADPTVEYEHTFTYTGTEQELLLPAGLRYAQVEAIGGRGATKGTKAGGFAAKVEGPVKVEGDEVLYVLVGGNASGEVGGWNGGGYGGDPSEDAPVGGGGGGASDVRTVPSFLGEESLLSRLLVAAGGGGAGALANADSRLNAAGGNAGEGGARAESIGADNTLGSGGFGGGAGTSSGGGGGGEKGYPYASGTGYSGEVGHPGSLGNGGEGGHGPFNHPPGWGGGGGGGLYGGGGGGGGSEYDGGETPASTGGGGGGGGSSLVPEHGLSVVDTESDSTPKILVGWAIPGTVIEGPAPYLNQNDPSYKLSSEEAGVEFECRLNVGAAEWESCEAEGTIPTIGLGDYVFEARAVNAEGNLDPTPAKIDFWVVLPSEPPVVLELKGPTETTETQPTFTFLGGSIIPVHFECAFDGAAPGPCSSELSDRPSSQLRVGSHTFTATPIDAAGNVGEGKSISFKVVGNNSPPPNFTPKVSLSGPKANAKKGTATVAADVNGAGTLKLSGAGVRSVSATAKGAGKVALTIEPSAKMKKQLKKTGKAKVKVTVTFTATAGGSATATKTVMLRLKPATRHRGR